MGLSGVNTLTKKGSKWSKVWTVGSSPGDNGIDKMNHIWTVFLLVAFAIAVSKGQFFGDNIRCWFPAEFEKDSWIPYGNSYCWIKNTYLIPMDEPIPTDDEEREENEITYYQWVPLILLFQAFLFKFPNVVWTLLNSISGINLEKVIGLTQKTQLGSPDDRTETIDYLAQYLDKWIHTHRQYKWDVIIRIQSKLAPICGFVSNKRTGTFLTSLFLFVKLLYFANVIGQFSLLNAFLSYDFSFYGFEVLDKLRRNELWRESPRFPRITFCDFKVRQLQNVLPYTVQCVLPINLYNEKIFIFVWFWLLLMTVLSLINLLYWAVLILIKQNRSNYAKKYLKLNDLLQTGTDKKLASKFSDSYLRDDGVFLLRVISNDSTEMVVSDLVTRLWEQFKIKSQTKVDERETGDIEEPLH